ncbi:MAG: 2Fe-2S iron-sulfur cluster-binding protein [Magnetovibrionaceae bacterium]
MAKAVLTFSDINLSVTVPVGTRVIEVSEKAGSGITYGCRECDCGTCMIKVEEGMENLSNPSMIEDKVLKEHMAGKKFRLACQAQVHGDVTIKPA